MPTKTVYQTNSSGLFVGLAEADPSPMEPGVWLIPGGCVETPPPTYDFGLWPAWNGEAWVAVPVDMSGESYVPETQEEIVATYTKAVDDYVEARARALKYNGAAHLASYVSSTVPDWANEAQEFVAWRDEVWLYVLAVYETAQLDPESFPALQDLLESLPKP